jgi:alkanesulfonate monooxygenase SsuD/methylene tetrahydromethanopterin reductase-like flavin-dependent oxidoreductase (luciferase family)
MPIRLSAELSHVCPVEDIPKHATALESHGFFRVWVPDTAVSPWEAWIAATVVAERTGRVKIGLGVTNPYTRHPVVAANMAATLQRMSGGRLAMSIGKGVERFLQKAGIEHRPSAVEECIAILRSLLTGERTSFEGEVFHLDGIRLRAPVPEAPVPFYLAAIGPPSWETALRVADGVATIWSDEVAETRRRVMAERALPTAALIPFSLSRKDFFEHRATSIEELEARVSILEGEGVDEAIIAYAELEDLKEAAALIGARE